MSNGSVGAISLDLVIKNKLEEQLEKIKSSVRSPAEKIGEAISQTVEKAMGNVGKSASRAIDTAVENAGRSVDDGIEAAVERAVQRMKKAEETLSEASGEAAAADIGGTFDFGAYMSKIDDFINTVREKLGAVKFEISDKSLEAFGQTADKVIEKIDLMLKKWQELSSGDSLGSEIPQDSDESGDYEKSSSKVLAAAKKIGKEAASFITAPLRGIKNTLSTVIKTPFFTALNAIKSGYAKLKYYLENPLLAVRDVGKKVFSTLKTAGSKALGALGKAAGSIGARFRTLGKSAASVTKPVSKLGNSLKRAFKSVFLMAGVYAAFRAFKNGLAEAAKADEDFSRSLNAVKANLSIAFTPILQAIMPALNTLMSGLASVTRSVAGFIAGLFGTTYKQAAEATKKLKGVSDTAKKAKLSTAGIDEMNILSDGSDSSSGSDKGADYSNIDMSEPKLPDWAQRLKDSIRSGDWSGVGAILAERVNSVLGSINWDKIQSKVNSGIGKITDLINGFLDNVNWDTLGDTLAGGLNTITGAINTFYSKVKWDKLGSGIAKGLNRAIKKTNRKQLGKAFSARIQAVIDTAYSFVTTFDWSGFGSAIGTAVNAWFDGIDFGKAGAAISGGIKGMLDFAIKAVQTIDWRQIGSKIAEFIGNIDFFGIARRFFELLGSALGAAVSLLWGAIQNTVFAVRDYFSEKIEECGGSIVGGLFRGIGDALKSVGKWIKDNIFKPFIEGFKKAFGIHSPSREMAVMGGYIIDGLFNAISDGIAKIKEIFSRMLETIKEVFSKIDSWFSEKFSAAWSAIKEVFSGIGGWFSDRWSDIKRVFSTVGTWFGEAFSEAWTKVKEAFSGVEKFFGDMWNSIKGTFTDLGEKIGDSIGGAFKTVINGVLSTIEDIVNGGINMINGAIKFINKIPGVDIGKISTLELPRLANGGLATAPTLAMVGDNRNASVDPEVIAPLSKLQGMLGGGNSKIIELLKVIIQLLKSGISAEIIGSLFGGDFQRAVLKICADDRSRRGG